MWRVAALVVMGSLLGCGGRTISSGGDETGSESEEDLEALLSCEGPHAPTEPVELVSGEMQPTTFARVGERIYWADGWDPWGDEPSTTLYRTKAAAGEPWVVVAEAQPGVNQIVGSAEGIFWVVEGSSDGEGALLRANLDDEVEVLDDNLLSPRALSLGGDGWIYYAEGFDWDQPAAKILRIRPDGSSKQLLSESNGEVNDVAIEESHVWWATSYPDQVWRVDTQGGQPELIATVYTERIEVQGGVAWTLGFTGLYKIVVGDEPHFVNGFSGPYELAVDSEHAYITMWNIFEDTHLGWIHRYPITKADVGHLDGQFVVDKFSPKPTAVRVDEQAVYWSTADEDSGQGAIWMLCKSAI